MKKILAAVLLLSALSMAQINPFVVIVRVFTSEGDLKYS